MKDSAEHGARLKRLCNRVRRELRAPVIPPQHDPTTELVHACLSWATSEAKAAFGDDRVLPCIDDRQRVADCDQ